MAIDELQKQLETIQDGFVRSVIFPGRAGLERINTVQRKSAAGQQSRENSWHTTAFVVTAAGRSHGVD